MNNYLALLEHISNNGILVISRDTFAVLYCNQTFLNAYPDTRPGENVEKLFQLCGEVCPLKGFLRMQEGLFFSPERRLKTFLRGFGGEATIQIDDFLWEERLPAYIISIMPVMLSTQEKYYNDITNAVNSAMVKLYPFVMIVNLTGDRYQVAEASMEYDTCTGDAGIFSEFTEHLLNRVHPEYEKECREKVEREVILEAFANGKTEIYLETMAMRSDHEYHWMAVRIIRICMEDVDRVSCIVLLRNVDYRKTQQERLQATLDATYSAIPGGIVEYAVDDKLTVLFLNKAFCELMEKTPEDYAGGYKEHILAEDREQVMTEIYGAARRKQPFDVVYRVRKAISGEIVWVHSRGVQVDEREHIPVYLAIRLDVTQMKNAEMALLEERARADLAMGTANALRFEYDEHADLLTLYFSNSDMGQMLRKQQISHYIEEIECRKEVHPEDRQLVRRVFGEGKREPVDVRLKYPEMMDYGWYRIKSSDVADLSGRSYVVGIIENISKEKELESANKNLQDQLGFVISDSFERMYIIDARMDTCTIMYMSSHGRNKKPVCVKFSSFVRVVRDYMLYAADLDNFNTKYLYLTSAASFEKGRSEIYFDIRVRDSFGPEYHWYTILIRQLEEEDRKFICLIKNVDELRKQEDFIRQVAEQQKYQKFSEQIIDSLGTLVEFRDNDSGEHIKRTRQLTRILLKYLAKNVPSYRLNDEMIAKITTASSMHDVGKISIPDAILNKPGRLTTEEFSVMKTHTTKGYDILRSLNLGQDEEFNRYCCEICRYHHERYDGNGYPDHLVGDEIPIWGQIVSVVDVYDALVSPRVYKSAYSHDTAMEMIIGGDCGCFNPELLAGLRACAGLLRECYA